jgi:predicted nuclease of predicted toxin-antitoxin system
VRFLIDECLTLQLVGIANGYGHEAHHVARLEKAGARDHDLATHAWQNDFILVTNNSADFVELYAHRELHAGLIIIIPNVHLELQKQLFAAALDSLVELGEPINQVLYIDLDSGEVVSDVYQLHHTS